MPSAVWLWLFLSRLVTAAPLLDARQATSPVLNTVPSYVLQYAPFFYIFSKEQWRVVAEICFATAYETRPPC